MLQVWLCFKPGFASSLALPPLWNALCGAWAALISGLKEKSPDELKKKCCALGEVNVEIKQQQPAPVRVYMCACARVFLPRKMYSSEGGWVCKHGRSYKLYMFTCKRA
eukprot:1160405-Pelagomonas_calceolata.AAC.3